MTRAIFSILAAAGAVLGTAATAEAGDRGLSGAEFQQISLEAREGNPRAQRRLALLMLGDEAGAPCDGPCTRAAVDQLAEAARGGDLVALVSLENLRREGGPEAPSLEEIVAVEIERAGAGDPVAAWRLANRYQTGEGVKPSGEEAIRWLKVVANAEPGASGKSTDAAYRLCEVYTRGDGVDADARKAVRWCEKAAGEGHAGAALVLAQLKRLDG